MKTQTNFVRCVSSCMKLVRSKTAGELVGPRSISGTAQSKYWTTPKGIVSAFKSNGRNMMLDQEHQHQQQQQQQLQLQRQPKQRENVGTRRTMATGRYYGNSDDDSAASGYVRMDDAMAAKRRNLDDAELSDGSFDPRYNDRHYRTYRNINRRNVATTATTSEKNNRSYDKWYYDRLNEQHWLSWDKCPERREQEFTKMRNDGQKAAEFYAEKQQRQPMRYSKRSDNYMLSDAEEREQERLREQQMQQITNRYGFLNPKDMLRARKEEALREAEDESTTTTVKRQPNAMVPYQRRKKPLNKYEAKKQRQAQEKFWHTWSTCPDERLNVDDDGVARTEVSRADEDDDAYGEDSVERMERRQVGLRKSSIMPNRLNFDGARRKYRTSSWVAQQEVQPEYDMESFSQRDDVVSTSVKQKPKSVSPPVYCMRFTAKLKRKPNGLEKQIHKVWDYTRNEDLRSQQRYEAKPYSTRAVPSYADTMDYDTTYVSGQRRQLVDTPVIRRRSTSLPNITRLNKTQNERKRYNSSSSGSGGGIIDDAVEVAPNARRARDAAKVAPPPKFSMLVKKYKVQRRAVPVPSFSERISVNVDRYVPHSEYLGYGKPSMCDVWSKFTNIQISRA